MAACAARALLAPAGPALVCLADADAPDAPPDPLVEDRPGFADELCAGVAVMRPPDGHDEGTEPPSRAEAITKAETQATSGTKDEVDDEHEDDAGQGTDSGAHADHGAASAENGDARETAIDV